MNQQTIDKLMKLKKLQETGVLTKEEMESEKKKIFQSDSDGNNSQKSVTPKKKTTKKPWLILVIVVLIAIGGWYCSSNQQPPSSFKESVEGIQINDRYDETLEKLKADPENKKRGMATNPEKTIIGVFHKTYHGVVFDFVYFSFSGESVKAIELRKIANHYDGDAAQIINEAYNSVESSLRRDYSSCQETDEGVVFFNESEKITIHQEEDFSGQCELNVKIEKK